MKNILVTGGAGFIGSNFVHLILEKYDDLNVVVYDKLTYAGNLDNLAPVADDPRYHFHQGDISDADAVDKMMAQYGIDAIVNFAAETHVDRSLMEPGGFIQTDVYGTYVLLEAAKNMKSSAIIKSAPTRCMARFWKVAPLKGTGCTRAVPTRPARPAAI